MARRDFGALLTPALAFLLAAGVAPAAPLDPATQQQLLSIIDDYDKAIMAGKLDAAMALMSKHLHAHAASNIKTKADRAEAIEMAQMMTPDSISVVHSFIDAKGNKARIVTVASKTVPKDLKIPDGPPPGSVVRNGMTVSFVKEGGAWKFDEQLFEADPTEVTGCKSETADPRAAYDPDKNVNAGGPIVRVDFKPDYTLVVYSVVGEPNCAFLPAKADLAKLVDPSSLVPYAIVEMDGIPHRTDPQKMLVETVKVQPEE